ncbi:MarR family winged helix-turn-helix transcriptional regulator [Yinghuangia aomiensis]
MTRTHAEGDVDEIQRGLELLLRVRANRRGHAVFAQAAGVSVSQSSFEVLSLLSRTGPLPMGKIAQQTGTDRTATTRTVDRLFRVGFVRRLADAGDRRRVLLAMTWRGVEAHRKIATLREQHIVHVLRGWDAVDVEAFAGLLARFVEDAAVHELETAGSA